MLNYIFVFNFGVLVSCKKVNEVWLYKIFDKFMNDFVMCDFVMINVSEIVVFY